MPGHQVRLSACTANYGDADLFTIIDRAAEIGLDGVELTVMYHLPVETSATRLADVRKKLDDSGVAASALHFLFPAGLSFVDAAASARRRVSDHIGRVAEMAAIVGAEVLMVGGGGIRSYAAGQDPREAEERVVGVYDDGAALAGTHGVAVAFEAVNRYETNIGRTLTGVQHMVRRTGNPWLGVGGDTFHMNIEELDLAAAIRAVDGDLKHLHLADSHRLAPGDGHVDFPAILSALDEVGYTGWMSMELFAIAPGLMHLETFELCDEQVVRGAAHIRSIQGKK